VKDTKMLLEIIRLVARGTRTPPSNSTF